jgi:site-specific DNA-methyltransferase (adenine-specific)
MELRQGRWQDVLADVAECDAVITDPPYSPRQHSGFRSGSDFAEHRKKTDVRGYGSGVGVGGIPYKPTSQAEADALLDKFNSSQWVVVFGDHISFRWWESAADRCERYVFAPVIWDRGWGCRFQGDGPSSDVEYICVSRLKRKTKCGSLPGIYRYQPEAGSSPDKIVRGQKPVPLMRAIVRDYSRPGDLIVDPCAGGGTTLLAAAMEGRRAIGAEMDPETFKKAVRRLSAGYTSPLFGGM